MTGRKRTPSRAARANRDGARGSLIRRVAAEHRPTGIGGPTDPVSCTCGRWAGANESLWWEHFGAEAEMALRGHPARYVAVVVARALEVAATRLYEWARV